eukprot:CAMPEP_0182873194 /NCGR_PEP_ID=MMETSP0034_2-20130328/12180_1 /TAXON_ID=156128 /ORGANISM="Nephroselmis pyriformis, Strain CCMP717" /LENGTH=236 /DNA_ID=CAMNT_0025005829 /DNA_START=12 /DNA_END=718 /DNA_ORIENTATION=+
MPRGRPPPDPAKCRHGMGDPSEELLVAVSRSIQLAAKASDEALEQVLSDESVDRNIVMRAETSTLEAFWSMPEHERLISPDACRLFFSMATDAVLDGEQVNAGTLLRNGFFLRQWAKVGGRQFLKDLYQDAASKDDDYEERNQELHSSLKTTRTLRGITLYLDQLNSCACLRGAARQASAEAKDDRCMWCEVQKPKTQLKRCAKCRMAVYCSAECQKKHWKNCHKHECADVATYAS